MDTLIISKENNILHICNHGYSVDYTIYNSKGHSMDGGILESDKSVFDNKTVIKDIINMIQERYDFEEPYMYLYDGQMEGLLELIELEDYKNTHSNVDDYLTSLKNNSSTEMELIK